MDEAVRLAKYSVLSRQGARFRRRLTLMGFGFAATATLAVAHNGHAPGLLLATLVAVSLSSVLASLVRQAHFSWWSLRLRSVPMPERGRLRTLARARYRGNLGRTEVVDLMRSGAAGYYGAVSEEMDREREAAVADEVEARRGPGWRSFIHRMGPYPGPVGIWVRVFGDTGPVIYKPLWEQGDPRPRWLTVLQVLAFLGLFGYVAWITLGAITAAQWGSVLALAAFSLPLWREAVAP